MEYNVSVHPFCDICGKELSQEDIDKCEEAENFEYPFCYECFKTAFDKIIYVINN